MMQDSLLCLFQHRLAYAGLLRSKSHCSLMFTPRKVCIGLQLECFKPNEHHLYTFFCFVESSLCSLCSECLDHHSVFSSCCSTLPSDFYHKKILHSKWVQGTVNFFYKAELWEEKHVFHELCFVWRRLNKVLLGWILGRTSCLCGGNWTTRP